MEGVNWTKLFQKSWEAHHTAAQFIADRMAEASKEAAAFHDVLTHVATVYREHDENFAKSIIKLTAEAERF